MTPLSNRGYISNSNKDTKLPIINSFTQIQRTAWSLTALLLLMVSNTFAADPPNIVFILSDDQAWSDYGFS